MYRIGIDVGGTFTDFTLLNGQDGQVHFHKVRSLEGGQAPASPLLQTTRITLAAGSTTPVIG